MTQRQCNGAGLPFRRLLRLTVASLTLAPFIVCHGSSRLYFILSFEKKYRTSASLTHRWVKDEVLQSWLLSAHYLFIRSNVSRSVLQLLRKKDVITSSKSRRVIQTRLLIFHVVPLHISKCFREHCQNVSLPPVM